jgi:hypothetical protein
MNANKDISYDEPAKWEILTSANAQTIYFAPLPSHSLDMASPEP